MDEHANVTAVVLDRVKDCVGTDIDVCSLRPEMQIHTLSIDSLKMIQIVFEIEVHFGIELPEHALFQVETLRDLINLVRLAIRSSMACRKAGAVCL
jgi:acyl carrier protein